MLICIGCVAYIVCLHALIAHLASMHRLHCIEHACLPLELSMIEVELYVCIWFACHLKSKCTLGFLGHNALKCVIGGLRIEYHPPLSHKHDKGCIGAHI